MVRASAPPGRRRRRMDTAQPAAEPDGERKPRPWRTFLSSIDPGDGWLWTWMLTFLVLGVGLGTYWVSRAVSPPSREWAKAVGLYVAALAGHADTRAQHHTTEWTAAPCGSSVGAWTRQRR